ncbi:MAG: hypothetical protein V7721_10565 [Porticoccaceae bacterium]
MCEISKFYEKNRAPFILSILLCISVLSLFHIAEVRAGSITEELKADCPVQYEQYKAVVNEYAIRIRENAHLYGCGVISAYGVFINNDIDRIERWEDNPESFESVSQVFLISEQYNININESPFIFETLSLFISSDKESAIRQLDLALSQASRYELERINSQPQRIIYLIWALHVIKDNVDQEVFEEYHQLMRDFPLKFLPAVLVLDIQIAQAYPSITASGRINLIKKVLDDYPAEFLTRVADSPRAMPGLIFLLPVQLEDIQNIQNLNEGALNRLQQDYASSIKELLKLLNQLTGDAGLAMETMSIFAPHILDALAEADRTAIMAYLEAQLTSPVFSAYLRQSGNCNYKDFTATVATFFSFLAPHGRDVDDTIKPIAYLQHNLARIANWYSEDETMRTWVSAETEEPQAFIKNMSQLPYYFINANPTSQKYISRLLEELPGDINKNATFLLDLRKNTNYFEWVWIADDVEAEIKYNEAITKKYLFILTTPFPSRLDSSVYQRFQSNGSGIFAIMTLQNYSQDSLERHTFTEGDEWLEILDKADTVAIYASIVLIPLTAGGSTALTFGARTAVSILAVTAVRISARKIVQTAIRKGTKTITKSIRTMKNSKLPLVKRATPISRLVIKGYIRQDNVSLPYDGARLLIDYRCSIPSIKDIGDHCSIQNNDIQIALCNK